MPIISNAYFLFIIAGLLIYYLIPGKAQMAVLLSMNILFYVSYGMKALFFIMFSICTTYLAGRSIDLLYQHPAGDGKSKVPAESIRKARWILIIVLILNLGVLGVLKYTNFIIDNLNRFEALDLHHLDLLLPLGISYYTFQSIGYLLDVYWRRVQAEKGFLRLAVFLSFFPYMLQGPINRYGTLAHQLWEPHGFRRGNIRYGVLRILWGLFKKMVLADWAAVYADAIFSQPDQYAGIAGFGVLLYSIEIYGNFSGGIDIVIGTARLFGITMDENFKRPFFSDSVADFWRRWHITLGTWMKDYVMFPLTMSKTMKKLGKKSKKLLGKKTGRNIPVAISTMVVFFLVGVWHGASWGFIGWGVYNGMIIVFSTFAEEFYKKSKKILHIHDQSTGWRLFKILRTFLLINLSWYFVCVSSLGDAVKMIGYSLTRLDLSLFLTISSGKLGTDYTPAALTILITGCLLLFTVSFFQEKGVDFDSLISKRSFGTQILIFLVLFMISMMFSPMSAGKGFIYAQF